MAHKGIIVGLGAMGADWCTVSLPAHIGEGRVEVVAAVDVNPDAFAVAKKALGLRGDQLFTEVRKAFDAVPADSLSSFAGVGNPFVFGALRPGEIVLDIGSGAGFDSFIAARQVGPTGRVVGVDMTDAMLDKACAAARTARLTNVEFRKGLAEELPLDDASVDVVLSNGVINLCPDKVAVYRDAARVLRPGGRLQIADIIVEDQTQSPRPFINRGDAVVQGVETEVIAASKQGSYAYVNYSYWDAEDGDHEPLADVPHHIANVGFNLLLWKMLNLNANLHYMGERERGPGDTRRDLEDFIRVDAAAGIKIGKHVDIVGSVYNIFDTDIREPSISLVPEDYPMPGRTFFFRVRYRF